ncbi:hypothetical protein GCM10008171_17070 [Methylopila jiangsuensis]|uniref:DUF1491 family protein n=1 Tax=Methylopila jiangsuensis TaxID=586230 RepID=A0A9W6N3M7_9HYPH|nr:DUF1491 family protein [Methylopila jiangsuensis]MDR6284034.1 hypothetical protein [Methylopila jiangsuensis]GLK76453.1 hypothetical protein GCM10008171_17070 [Methylopila jiangsuensis]
MSSRLTSEFWVAAYVRRCHLEGAFALVRKRGAPEAGAIFIVVDRLDGDNDLYAPAPQSEAGDDGGRAFERVGERMTGLDVEERLARERRFDSDLWIVAVEDRRGRAFLD